MSLIEGILKPFSGLFALINSPLGTVILLLLVVFAIAGFYLWRQINPKKKILYCSEEENQGIEFTVKRQTPAHLYTNKKDGDIYRFIRFRDAFTFTIGMQTITRWFGKKGTAYAKKLESGDVGEFTLLKIMQSVWGEKVVDELQDEQKQKLIKSEVMITVRLEGTETPDGYKPKSEIYITKESDEEMAKIFGENIRRELSREDWIRTAALLGCGVALGLVAQGMGLLGSFA